MSFLGIALIVAGAVLLLLTLLAPTFGVPIWVGVVVLIVGIIVAIVPGRLYR